MPKKRQPHQRRRLDKSNRMTPMLTRNCGFSKTSYNSAVRCLWKTMRHRFEIQRKRSRVRERQRQRILGLRTYTLQNHVRRGRRKRASQTTCQLMLLCDTCKSRKLLLFRLCRLYARRWVMMLIQTTSCLLFQASDFLLHGFEATSSASLLWMLNPPLWPKGRGSKKSSGRQRNVTSSNGLQTISQPLALDEQGT
jgi:hypothetical protein